MMKYWDIASGTVQAALGAGLLAQVVEGETLGTNAQLVLVSGLILVTLATVFLAHLRAIADIESDDESSD